MMPTRVKAKCRKQTQVWGKSGGHSVTQTLTPQLLHAFPPSFHIRPRSPRATVFSQGQDKGKIMPLEFNWTHSLRKQMAFPRQLRVSEEPREASQAGPGSPDTTH